MWRSSPTALFRRMPGMTLFVRSRIPEQVGRLFDCGNGGNQAVVAFPAIYDRRYAPGRCEDTDHGEAKVGQVGVEVGDDRPDSAFETKLIDQQAERLDASDQQRDKD